MARGQQKIQSQQKAADKKAKEKKAQTHYRDYAHKKKKNKKFNPGKYGHSLANQKAAASKALTIKCSVCLSLMPDPKTYKQHFENKHPKNELPADLKDIVV